MFDPIRGGPEPGGENVEANSYRPYKCQDCLSGSAQKAVNAVGAGDALDIACAGEIM